jgi:hypothetical protein
MHDPLIELATVPPTPIHPAVLAARSAVARIAADLLDVPDRTLDSSWRWRATDPDDVELRYGFYRVHERFESAIGTITVGRSGAALGPEVPPLEAVSAARWDLHGVLAALDDAALDADPGGGEWSVRETLGHILLGQLLYGWYNAWYLAKPLPVGEAVRPDESVLPPEPTEAELVMFPGANETG